MARGSKTVDVNWGGAGKQTARSKKVRGRAIAEGKTRKAMSFKEFAAEYEGEGYTNKELRSMHGAATKGVKRGKPAKKKAAKKAKKK